MKEDGPIRVLGSWTEVQSCLPPHSGADRQHSGSSQSTSPSVIRIEEQKLKCNNFKTQRIKQTSSPPYHPSFDKTIISSVCKTIEQTPGAVFTKQLKQILIF